MSGLLLIAVLALWVGICFSVAYAVGMLAFRSKAMVLAAATVGALVLVPIPVLDEIRGTEQFREVCEKRVFDISQEEIKGRAVKLEIPTLDERLKGTALPIFHTKIVLRDASTAQVLGTFDRYVARGGWLMRTLTVSENQSPLFIGKPVCQPPLSASALAGKYSFTITN